MRLQSKILISEQVAQFYKRSHETFIETSCNIFIDSNLCFNYKEIVRNLWPLDYNDEKKINKNLEYYEYKDYLKCYKVLSPIFQYANNTLKLNKNCNCTLYFDWLDNDVKCWELYTYVNSSDMINSLHTLESLLCLTALLENSLANIYESISQGNRKAPHLLKELVISEELKDVFGWESMIFLKILLGTPNSINLRNICWHGFPPINCISTVYHSVLLLTIHTLGFKLKAIGLQITMKRSQIKDFSNCLVNFPEELKTDNLNVQIFKEILTNYYVEFNESYLHIWQRVLEYYIDKQYVRFIIVILPQIELILRLYYGQINEFNVEAKLNEYYITVDTIFDGEVPTNSGRYNKLLDFSSHSSLEGCFKLIYDLFLAPNGCRLRDKVSHGEVYLEALNNSQLCSILLQLFLNILLPDNIKTLIHYESHLHINCQTKIVLLRAITKLHDIRQLECVQLQDCLQLDNRLDDQVLIFQRPHKERELMLSLRRITQNVCEMLYNYRQSLELSYDRLKQRELHSRKRQTLQNVSYAFPKIYSYLGNILQIVCVMFIASQKCPEIIFEEQSFNKSKRFLKYSLSISENLLKYSNPNINQWQRTLELCEKFKEYKQIYCINEIIIQCNEILNTNTESLLSL